VPRYVELPRPGGSGTINLVIGFGGCFLAAALFAIALFVGGARAFVPMLSCLLTFVVLWVVLRFRLLRRRNGAFAAIGLVALLGAIIPLVERGFVALAEASRTASALPVTPAEAASGAIPSLVQAFGITPPETSTGEFVKVTRDSRVMIEDKPYLLKGGDVFPLEERSATEVTFVAKDLRISLPADAVQVFGEKAQQSGGAGASTLSKSEPTPPPAANTPAAPETPTDITQRAQQEAIRKYPSLGVKDSPENESFSPRVLAAQGSWKRSSHRSTLADGTRRHPRQTRGLGRTATR
jgi:hypothetical protein